MLGRQPTAALRLLGCPRRVWSGVAWIVHGVMVPYIGLFDSIPRLVAIVLLAVWAFMMAVLMWRNRSRGRIARPEAAPPGLATPPASPR